LGFAFSGGLLCLVLLICQVGFAQQSPELVADPPVTDLPAAPSAPSPMAFAPGEPDFVPLSATQRASLFFRGYLGARSTYIVPVIEAGATQWAEVPKGWPRDLNGYGHRLGSEFALLTMEEGIHDAGDAALRLDPRYFSCRCSGPVKRTWNAFKMTLFAYDDQGYLHADMPRIAADYASSMLVTTWHPAPNRVFVEGIKMGHIELGTDFALNVIREFSPELKHVAHTLRLRH
jgi:hypothetical protein